MKLKKDSTGQKIRGAYYTPIDLAIAMVEHSRIEGAKVILEPSCGDGVFLDALRQCRALNEDMRIDAVELSEQALLAASKIPLGEASSRFIHRDFFEFYEESPARSYDLILGNPPYIRYQYLEAEQRLLLADILRRQGMKANKLVNAWVGFMVACTDLLADNGLLSFVVPAEILQVAYAEDLRRFLAREYEYVTLVTFRKLIFEDIEQETVIFIGKKGPKPGMIRVVEVEDISEMRLRDFEDVEYQPLDLENGKWTRYFVDAHDARTLSILQEDDRLTPLSRLATINVGVTTGNNSFFSLTDDVSEAYDLDDKTLPLIGRSSHASGVFFTEKDWEANRSLGKRARLLVLDDGEYESLSRKQKSYIDLGVDRGENRGYKCSIRNSWYSVPSVWIPDAFFLRRNNLYPKLVLNRCGAISTDTMHRIKFNKGVDPVTVVISYYNSIAFAFTELCGRSYGGGVLEILPKEVGNILVLDPRRLVLDESLKKSIVGKLDQAVREGECIDNALDYVDELVLVDILGFDPAVCATCRRVWKTLQARRLNRSTR